MSRPSTSKRRFADFVDKFRKGEFKHKHDEKEEKPDVNSPDSDDDKREKKLKRRGYLKKYIRELWPHWRMVLLLIFLAVCVAVLEIGAPLYGRYIIDNILLAEKTNSQKLWLLSLIHI